MKHILHLYTSTTIAIYVIDGWCDEAYWGYNAASLAFLTFYFEIQKAPEKPFHIH